MKKRVVLSTKLLIESGNYRSRAITRQEAADWLAAGPVDNFCGHETVRILGLAPDTTRRTCAGYDEALCLSAKSRLDFGREYSLSEIEAIGVEFTLISRIVTIEDVLELARRLPSGLCDEKSPLKLLKELEELEEAASLGDRIGVYLEAADVAYYAAKSIDLAAHKAGLAHAVQIVLEIAAAKYALRAQPGNPKNDAAERQAVVEVLE